MKKVFAILLSVVFLTAVSACGGSTPAPVVDEPQQVEEVTPCHEQEEVDGDEEIVEDVEVEEVQE
jgi:predicted small lipoprotein YifL